MNVIFSILSLAVSVGALISAIYVSISCRKIKKMQTKNREISAYVKNKKFLLMKNGGENPCDTKNTFVMPDFSQNSNLVVRR